MRRREALAALGLSALSVPAAAPPVLSLSTFSADITVPLGHALMGGGVAPAKRIDGPLEARGFVLRGGGKPVVLCVLDWCEVRNDAHTRWREVLAEAAGTDPARVLVSSIHQHDAPVADLEAERLLKAAKAAGSVCDPEFHEKAVQRTAKALKAGRPRRVTHVGTGMAKAERLASNRRWVGRDGKVSFGRTSATRDKAARDAEGGLIDPWLRCLSLWDGDKPLLALSAYAIHPMSYYGRGEVQGDFPALARRLREADVPGVFQVYASGCSGNMTAGKYNDGAPANRAALASRLRGAMAAAWKATKRVALDSLAFRSVPYRLEPRGGEFTKEALEKRLRTDKKPFGQCLAALGLSWRKQADAGKKLDLPALTLGPAKLLLLPGECYVEYQLLAQRLAPGSFVVALGYGECATGYVPTEKHWEERDGNLDDWCWVAPGAEKALAAAIASALK
ncbi:MAG: hypothetical protein K2W96_20940 [Gemmataceae bacterium]|nr:hypothetical protein [Gemmataceae bacterium]